MASLRVAGNALIAMIRSANHAALHGSLRALRLSDNDRAMEENVLATERVGESAVVVRASPFAFLKRLVIVELLFAFVPLALIGLAQIRAGYESLEISLSFSYDLLLILLLTTLQVLILVGLFVAWYAQAYQIDAERVIQRRGGLGMDRQLAETADIVRVEQRQGALGRRFGYATLALHVTDEVSPALMRDVPDPQRLRRLLEAAAALKESPANQGAFPALPAADAGQLIAQGEGQFVEFKASLQWDYRQQRVNKELYEPVMKNLAAFMNSIGGYVLIGVSDEGELLGLEPDLQAMQKGNLDGFENKFNVAFNTMIGAEFRRFVQATFPEVGGVTICLLATQPADEPVYLRNKGEESFYIRAGNGSQPLPLSKAARYIQSRF